MGRNPNASRGLQPETKAHCLCGVTPQPNKAASLTISLFVKISEAHLCYEKKIQSGQGSAGSLGAFQCRKGSRAPWWAAIMGADLPCRHVRNITRQTASISAKGLLLVSRLWLVGADVIKTHQPYVDTVLPLPYGNIYMSSLLFKHQSGGEPFELTLWHILANLQGGTLNAL